MKYEALDQIRQQIEGDTSPGCIEFKGTGTGKGGYGRITLQRNGKRCSFSAHRLAFECAYGKLNPGQIVRHTCHNPRCINPAHLVGGTHKQNADDRMKAGRCASQKGENNGNAKTSAADRSRIRSRREQGETLRSIAEDYGLHVSTVSAIARSNN